MFSHLFVNMVRAGETSGNLEEVLMRLAKFAEADAQLKQRVTTAMVYPAVLLIVGGGVILFVIVFLLPMFIKIYSEMSINLPLPTRILIATSHIMSAYGLFIFMGAAAGVTTACPPTLMRRRSCSSTEASIRR
jgi:type II secretory pathway component PulF